MRYARPAPSGPFSRFMSVDELSGLPGGAITITATPAECEALAAANELIGVSKLEAAFRVAPGNRDIHITGEMRAGITQTCVVTLEEFESDVREEIDVRYAAAMPPPPAGKKGRAAPRLADLGDEGLESDPPEPLTDGHIDLGAIAAEFLALSLDPYPRKPGAAFEAEDMVFDDEAPAGKKMADDKPESPFAALARLRKPE